MKIAILFSMAYSFRDLTVAFDGVHHSLQPIIHQKILPLHLSRRILAKREPGEISGL